MYSVFLSSYRNTRESLGELEKVLPNFHSCLYNSIETRYMFSISKVIPLIGSWPVIRISAILPNLGVTCFKVYLCIFFLFFYFFIFFEVVYLHGIFF